MAVKRFDAGRLDKAERTPQGGLRIPARPTRVGVFEYRNADGSIRREYRPEEEVFHPDSLRSLAGAPVTDLHPKEQVNPDNWRNLAVGHVSETVGRDGMYVDAPLLVQDAGTIRLIETGERKELSCGYECDIDPTPGVWNGQVYDVKQVKITYNHVAIGPEGWGRQGATVAIRLDSGDAVQVQSQPEAKEETMKTVRIDGVDYEVGSEAHLQAVEKRHKAQEAKVAEQATQIASVTAEREREKGRADAAEKTSGELTVKLKEATDPKTMATKIKARADMTDKLRQIYRARNKKFDAAAEAAVSAGSDQEVLIMAIEAMDPGFKKEGKSPDFIQGYFASLFQNMKAQLGGGGETNPGAEGTEGVEEVASLDSPDDDEEEPRRMDHRSTPHDARRGYVRQSRDDEEDDRPDWQKPLAVSKDRR